MEKGKAVATALVVSRPSSNIVKTWYMNFGQYDGLATRLAK